MIYITKFRVNDLSPSNGKQIEFNAKIVRDFFGFTRPEVEVKFKCLSLADDRFGKTVISPMKLSPARGDYKVYQNLDGSPNLKDVFLKDLGLTDARNIDDYYAFHKRSELEYEVYYIPQDLLFSRFFKDVAKDEIITLAEEVAESRTEDVYGTTVSEIDVNNVVDGFYEDVTSCGLSYDKELIRRFLSGVLAKQFLVLSGLSGSGKTKLAQSFASWMTLKFFKIKADGRIAWFEPGLKLEMPKGDVRILECDENVISFVQTSDTRACVPCSLVNEWVETIRKNKIPENAGSLDIKAKVVEEHPLSFSPTLHSFHAPLKALAFYQKDKQDAFMAAGGKIDGFNYKAGAYLVVPVGADWTNSEHLLGYPDALQPGKYVMPDTGVLKFMLDARDNPKLPFFLILDEMNLSHVERYFADFLSAMESGEDIKLYGGDNRSSDGIKIPQTLKFPKNLFIIGTMNVDETTYMFSPKVLDRAQVIEFRVSEDDMKNFLTNPSTPNLAAIESKGAKYAEAFLKLKDAPPALDAAGSTTNKDAIAAALNKFFPELVKLGAEFGYRSAGEIVRFCAYYLAAGATIDDAIDAAIVQKLLPKLHGSQARLGPVLRKLKELATKEETVTLEGGETKKVRTPLYTLTCEKLDRMLDRLKANGFTSFAEA